MKLVSTNKIIISIFILSFTTSCGIIKFPFKAAKNVKKSIVKKKDKTSSQFERFIRNMSSEERYKWYIKTYSKIAVDQMKKNKIPASIKLAQGLVESGAGGSNLALKSNNHFGIKCHQEWRGKKVYHDDDEKDECFRKYKNAEESYKDHSEFLTTRGRYSFLFKLPNKDYVKWANGLKKAGYATDPRYPEKLITVIEKYKLWKFDGSKKQYDSARRHAFWMDHEILRALYHNQSKVAPGVYRSNQPSPNRIKTWAKKGIKTIINLRGASNQGSYLLELQK